MPTARRSLFESLDARRLFAATFPRVYGGGGFDNAERIVQDAGGNLIVVGLFSGTANFAPAGQKAALLTARGDSDVYVAKYAADGSLTWAVRAGGDYSDRTMRKFGDRDIDISQNRFSRYVGRIGAQPRNAGEYVNDVAVDDAGNIFIAGAFRDTLKVGDAKLVADQTYTSSYYDAMVVKFTPAGQVAWANRYGGAFDDDAMSLGTDKNGNVTVGGYYSRVADFGGTGRRGLLKTDGRDAGFVLRLTNDGQFGWVYQFDSESIKTDERNAVNDIYVTRGGAVYFVGSFAADAHFQNGERGGFVLESNERTDSFVAALTKKGAFAWAESTGSEGYDANVAVTVDADGNVFTAGYFGDEMDVNPLPNVTTTFTPVAEDNRSHPEFTDLLVSKFTADGTPVWQSQVGGEYIELVGDLRVNADDSVFLTGSYFGTIDLAPGKAQYLISSTPTNDGSIKDDNTRFGRDDSYDWFAVRLSQSGKFVSGLSRGEADDDYNGGITPLADGSLLFYGRQVDSTVADRDDRQEQAWIYQVSPNLKYL